MDPIYGFEIFSKTWVSPRVYKEEKPSKGGFLVY